MILLRDKQNGIIVPDIVAGNTLFKAMVYMTGACSGGLVVGGKVPILLTSRADSAAARMASVALASVWRTHNETLNEKRASMTLFLDYF